MATNNQSQAIDTLFDVATNSPIDITVITEQMAQVIQQAVQQFANDPEFDSKMALTFGGNNDYTSLKTAWQSGEFDAFPMIEIRTGTELQGANAAYASATNTIYVSQDFLQKNADNATVIASVLVEEFGHSVDWKVNAGIDTPGDEGELFSAIVRGIDLAPSQLQQMKQENDFVVLELSGNAIELEQSTSTHSNGYTWNADYLLSRVIEQRGKTEVVFVNGIQTDSEGFDQSRLAIQQELNLKDWNNDFLPGYQTSFTQHQYKDHTQAVETELFNASYNSTQKDPYANLTAAVEALSKHLFRPAMQAYRDYWKEKFLDDAWIGAKTPDGLLAGLWASQHGESSNYDGYQSAKKIAEGGGWTDLLGMSDTQKEQMANFSNNFAHSKLISLAESIGAEVTTDLEEALSQFLSFQASDVSTSVNSDWVTSVLSLLESSNTNSVLLIAHSQGNFFIEDGLLSNPLFAQYSDRIRILGAGSPTNYSSLQGLYNGMLFTQGSEWQVLGNTIASFQDPITRLQLDFGDRENLELEKLKHLLNVFPSVKEAFVNAVEADLHNFNDGYLKLPGFKKAFSNYFRELNPQGYYFPQYGGFINSGEGGEYLPQFEGGNDGDYLDILSWQVSGHLNGRGGNDILRGGDLNDTFSTGDGWDFVDGRGGQKDVTEYQSWNQAIILYSDNVIAGGEVLYPNTYSDFYKVIKNDNNTLSEEDDVYDILVDIEEVFGSNYDDKMYGGEHNDHFLGNGGHDQLFGNEGDDKLDGGANDDDLVGGLGNDTIVGGDGVDSVYYTTSPDSIIVNIDESQAYSHDRNSRFDTSVSSINPEYYYFDLEKDFFINPGKAQDGFGNEDILQALENIQGTNLYNDILIGNSSANIIKGLGGSDLLIGNAGDDLLIGGDYLANEVDTVSYRRDPNAVSVNLQTGKAIDGWNGQDTLLYIENIVGSDSSGSDTLIGNDLSNYITGGNGNDRLEGLGGDDHLYGEFGNDTIIGGLGRDIIYGNQGIDVIWGDSEGVEDQGDNDYIRGGDQKDIIHAGGGDDTVWGDSGYGDDEIWGDYGQDLLYGGAGNDFISGGEGLDSLYGNDDNDTLEGNAGDDYLEGNAGDDRLSGGLGQDVLHGNEDNDVLNGNEEQDTLYGETGNDILNGDEGKDLLIGGSGNDTLSGGLDQDLLYGNDDDDVLYGNEEQDTLYGEQGNDLLSGGADSDRLFGDIGNDTLSGDAGTDYLEGNDGDDRLYGGTENDLLLGGADNDQLWGEDGNDILNGETGNDTLFGGALSDTLSGGLDDDFLYGEGGDDLLNGDSGNDHLFGQIGNDSLNGDIGDDFLDGGDGIDTLNGDIGNDTLYGQAGNDSLDGGSGNDRLDGGDGLDRLFGRDGNDTLAGQAGNDLLYGELGDDVLSGGDGKDYLEGNDGNDTLEGGSDFDTLYGNNGEDSLNGGSGNDFLMGGQGNDTINGGGDIDQISYLIDPSGVIVNLDETKRYKNDRQANANAAITDTNPSNYYIDLESDFAINPGTAIDGFGDTDTLIDLENITGSQFDDILIGNSRNNTLFGLGGNDILIGNGGNDIFYGGNGTDTVSYRRSSGSVFVNLERNEASGAEGYDRIYDLENVVGSNFDDSITGDVKANTITGGAGNDFIAGQAGDDSLYGETGNDQVLGGDGNDRVFGNLGNDELFGEIGDDSLYGGDGDDLIRGGQGQDKLYGDTGKDKLFGDEDNDELYGHRGDDYLNGGIGNDTLNGGEDNDFLTGEAGNDWLDAGSGADQLWGGDGNDSLDGRIGNDLLDGGADADQLFGGDGADTLQGQTGNDRLDGGTGQDYLNGGDDDDTLFGQADNDTLDGGAGHDVLEGGSGDDDLYGQVGNDVLSGDIGNDRLWGGDGNDNLDGGIGQDSLWGGIGDDYLSGQAGQDLLEGGDGNDWMNGGLDNDTLKGGQGNDVMIGGGNQDLFYINLNEGIDTIQDFGGVGQGVNPSPMTIQEVDTIKFTGAGLTANNMVLHQDGDHLVISFEDIQNTEVTLQNFSVFNLDNHHISTGASTTIGNILFDGQTTIVDSFDVIDVDENLTRVSRTNFITFLNNLNNQTSGWDYSNDVINGMGGNDLLWGLSGNDTLRSGEGSDTLYGGQGNDFLNGQWDNDFLDGGLGNDTLRGGDGNDYLIGSFGNDTLQGQAGNDRLVGGGGQDLFIIQRGEGDDTIVDFDGVGPGSHPSEQVVNEFDILKFEGAGLVAKNMILTQTDFDFETGTSLLITFEGITDTSVTLNHFSLENLDNLPTYGDDGSLIGNVLFQFDGDDRVKDSFDVVDADWTLNQVLKGNTVTFLNELDNEVSGFDWSDDVINGQGGNDILLGLGGNDILRGGSGDDVLVGGTGTDILTGNTGADTFVLSLGGFSLVNDFILGEDFIGLGDGLTYDQLQFESGTGINAGSTSIKILGDDSVLMSLKGVQSNALTTDMFLPASSFYQPSMFA